MPTQSYSLPQFTGPLFLSGDGQRSFLRLIGTLDSFSGDPQLRAPRIVRSNYFTVSNSYGLDSASQPAILEGADASFTAKTVSNVFNAVQIFQEGVKLSYSATAMDEQVDEWGSEGVAGLVGEGPPDQLALQVRSRREQIARDMNFTFLRGTFAAGATGSARKTRGLDNAITSNVDTAGADRALTKAVFEGAIRNGVTNGVAMGGEFAALGDAVQFDNLINVYEGNAVPPESIDVAGVTISRIRTKYGVMNVALDVDMPAKTLFVLDPRNLRAVAREIPGKGLLFLEPLGRAGAADPFQIYGEWGLDYGLEERHLKIDSLEA